jgi:hypothetical protein
VRALLWLLPLAAAAQTAVRPEQIKAPAAQALRIFAADASGKVVLLDLGPGVAIVGNRITATATQQQPAVELTQVVERLVPDGAGAFVARPTATYTRNGLKLIEGTDYTVTATTFKPLQPWTDDDVFAAHLVKVQVRLLPMPVTGAP